MTTGDEQPDSAVDNLFREVDDQFKDLEREYNEAREELGDVNERPADPLEASKERFELMSEVAALRAEISRLGDELDERDRLLAELGGRIDEFEEAENERDQMQADLRAAEQRALDEKREQARLEALLEARAAERHELADVAHRLQNERDHVQDLLTTALTRFDEVENVRTELDDNLRHLQAAQDTAKREHEARSDELIDARAEVSRLSDQVAELTRTSAEAAERADKAEAFAERKTNEAGYLNRRLEAMSDKMSESDGLDEQVASLQRELALVERNNTDLERQLAAQQAEVSASAAAVESLAERASEHDSLVKRIEVLEQERDDAWKAASQALSTDADEEPTAAELSSLAERARELGNRRSGEPEALPARPAPALAAIVNPPPPPAPPAPVVEAPAPPPPPESVEAVDEWGEPVADFVISPPTEVEVSEVAVSEVEVTEVEVPDAEVPEPVAVQRPPMPRPPMPAPPVFAAPVFEPAPALLPVSEPEAAPSQDVEPDEFSITSEILAVDPNGSPPAPQELLVDEAAIVNETVAEINALEEQAQAGVVEFDGSQAAAPAVPPAPPAPPEPAPPEPLVPRIDVDTANRSELSDGDTIDAIAAAAARAEADARSNTEPEPVAEAPPAPLLDEDGWAIEPTTAQPEWADDVASEAPAPAPPPVPPAPPAPPAPNAPVEVALADLPPVPPPPALPTDFFAEDLGDSPQFDLLSPASALSSVGSGANVDNVRKRTILPAALAPNTPEAVAHLLNQRGVVAIVDARSTCGRTGIRPSELFERMMALRDHFDVPVEVVCTPVSTPVGGAPQLAAIGVHHVTGADTVADRVRALCMGFPADQPLVVIAGDDHVRRAAIGEEANVVEPAAVLDVVTDR